MSKVALFVSSANAILIHREGEANAIAELSAHSGDVLGVSLSGRGGAVASAGADARIAVTRVKDGAAIMGFAGAEGAPATHVSFSPGDAMLCGGFGDGAVVVWELQSGKTAANHTFGGAETTAGVWLNKEVVAAASSFGEIALIEAGTRSSVTQLAPNSFVAVRSIAFQQSAPAILAAAHSDGSIAVFDAQKLCAIRAPIKSHSHACNGVAFLPETSQLLVSCGADARLCLTDLRERRTAKDIAFDVPLTALASTSSGVLVGTERGDVVGVDLRRVNAEHKLYSGHRSHAVNCIATSRSVAGSAATAIRPTAESSIEAPIDDSRMKTQIIASLSAAAAPSKPLSPKRPPADDNSLQAIKRELKDFVREEANALRLDLILGFERQKEELRAIVREELARRRP